jgi:hypothetical protein
VKRLFGTRPKSHAFAPATACACCSGPLATTAVTRRKVLAGGAAVLAATAVGDFSAKIFAQDASGRIDVHHHFASPDGLQALKLMDADDPVIANWSVQKSLDDMDKGGVATAVLSANIPQARPLGRSGGSKAARRVSGGGRRESQDDRTPFRFRDSNVFRQMARAASNDHRAGAVGARG